uniref:C2H2-type domain-containing protein n=1 Tax=Sphenodon punctatus TaxID=8508 RepID=A0A8D0L4R6_SPHPU
MNSGKGTVLVENRDFENDHNYYQKVPMTLFSAHTKGEHSLTDGKLTSVTILKDEKEPGVIGNELSDYVQEPQMEFYCKETDGDINAEGILHLETGSNETDDRRKRRGSADETLRSEIGSCSFEMDVNVEKEQIQSSTRVNNGDCSTADLPEGAGDLAVNACETTGSNISEDLICQSGIDHPTWKDKEEDFDCYVATGKNSAEPRVEKPKEMTFLGQEHKSQVPGMRLSSLHKPGERSNFQCRFCSSAYKCSNLLKKHVYSAHHNKKNHKCCFCQRTFLFVISLKRHLKFHKNIMGSKNRRKRRRNTEKDRSQKEKAKSANWKRKKKKKSKYQKFFIKIERDFKPMVTFSCKLCPFASSNPKLFIHHMKEHTDRPPYQCPQCEYISFSIPYLRNHMYWHAGYELYRCKFCTFFSRYFASMVKHSYIHTGAKPYSCKFCQSSFTSASGLKRHVSIHSSKELFQEQECNNFPIVGKRTERPPKNYMCDQCSIVFYTRKHLHFHKKFHLQHKGCSEKVSDAYVNDGNENGKSNACEDGKESQKTLTSLSCPDSERDDCLSKACNQLSQGIEFEPEDALQKDRNAPVGKKMPQSHQCSNLSIVGSRSEMLPNIYTCKQCDCVFYREEHLLYHKDTHSQAQAYAEVVRSHREAEDNARSNDVQHSQESLLKLFKCQQCDYTTYIFSNLRQHFRTHTGEKPFSCKECEKSFRSSSHLRRHSLLHLRKRHQCGLCLYIGSTLEDLKLHQETCKGKSLTKENLGSSEALINVHSTQEGNENIQSPRKTVSRLYKCEQCNYSTYVFGNLKLHIRIHTGERPYSCDTCQKKFRTSSHLNRHKFVHLNMEHLKCSSCGYSTNKWQSLKQHMISHSAEKRVVASQLEEQSPLAIKMYTCETCDYISVHSGNFKQHLRIHTGEKPYRCGHCALAFRTSGHLKRHLITHATLSCTKCEFSTKDKCALQKHIKTHKDKKHKDKKKKDEQTHKEKKIYKCTSCNITLPTLRLFTKHQSNHAKTKA